MTFDLAQSLDVLRRTPAVLDALLRGTSPSWHTIDEGPDTWSALGVVGHLIHGEETDWIPRARMILEGRATTPFEPFDRFAQFTRFEGWTIDRCLDRFSTLRQDNLELLRSWHLTADQLDLRGLHPELGPVSLRELLATWTVHDLGHIAQISRVMAKGYADEVGPWQAYVPVLGR